MFYNKIITHAGIFHADDVFAVAAINIICDINAYPRPKIIRTFNTRSYINDNKSLIIDIGGGKFDHHFPDDKKLRRDNGIPYATFGLIMKEFHNLIMSDAAYEILDKHFIVSLDANDNNGNGNDLASAIGTFNLNWDECGNSDQNFDDAVHLAEIILSREIKRSESAVKAKIIADTSPILNKVIYLDKFAPIGCYLIDKPVDFIGSPSLRGGYQLISIRNTEGNNKRLFPEKYRGQDFRGTNNKYGIKFCHSSGFLMSFIDKTHAMKFMDEKMI